MTTTPYQGIPYHNPGIADDLTNSVETWNEAEEASSAGGPGADGDDGWSPVFAVVTDSARRVLQIADWVGGTGTKPSTGDYVGPSGLTAVLASAVDIRGTAGAAGSAGAAGATGAAGNTILYGTAAPTTEGVDGNFYIRTSTNFIYGPKAAGVWPSGVSLVGPTGSTGSTGATGATGPAGLAQETKYSGGNAGSAVTISLANGTIQNFTLNSATCAFTLPTAADGLQFTLNLTQDGTGGRLYTLVGTYKAPQAVLPTLSTGINKRDQLVFTCSDSTLGWDVGVGGLDLR